MRATAKFTTTGTTLPAMREQADGMAEAVFGHDQFDIEQADHAQPLLRDGAGSVTRWECEWLATERDA